MQSNMLHVKDDKMYTFGSSLWISQLEETLALQSV